MNYDYAHITGFGVFAAGVILFAIMAYGFLENFRVKREERRQQDAYQDDPFSPTALLSGDPMLPRPSWDGETYAYPQSWEWPEDMTVTQFLDRAPAVTAPMAAITAQQPVIGIRTSGPFPALDAIEDTEEWIRNMKESTDRFLAQLSAPLTTAR